MQYSIKQKAVKGYNPITNSYNICFEDHKNIDPILQSLCNEVCSKLHNLVTIIPHANTIRMFAHNNLLSRQTQTTIAISNNPYGQMPESVVQIRLEHIYTDAIAFKSSPIPRDQLTYDISRETLIDDVIKYCQKYHEQQ